jgi:hypothetical protein
VLLMMVMVDLTMITAEAMVTTTKVVIQMF